MCSCDSLFNSSILHPSFLGCFYELPFYGTQASAIVQQLYHHASPPNGIFPQMYFFKKQKGIIQNKLKLSMVLTFYTQDII